MGQMADAQSKLCPTFLFPDHPQKAMTSIQLRGALMEAIQGSHDGP